MRTCHRTRFNSSSRSADEAWVVQTRRHDVATNHAIYVQFVLCAIQYVVLGANTHAACVFFALSLALCTLQNGWTSMFAFEASAAQNRFANASGPAHNAWKINRNHVNNFHRLSSRLSWLVFHDIYLLQRSACMRCSHMAMFVRVCVCARASLLLRSQSDAYTYICLCCSIMHMKITDTRTMISCRLLALSPRHTGLHHIWCDHFAVQINDFLQLEILIWNCFDAFVAVKCIWSRFLLVNDHGGWRRRWLRWRHQQHTKYTCSSHIKH